MPIDAAIPLQVQPVKIDSGINQLAGIGEAMKIGEMQRGIETQNKLRDLYSQGVDVSTPEGFKQVAAIDPKTAMALRNDALKTLELQGNIKKTGVEINQKTYDFAKQKMADLAFNPSDNNVKAHLEDGILRGEVTPAQANQTWQTVSAMPLDQRKNYFTELGVKVEERYKMNTMSAADKARLGQAERHFQIGQQGAGQALTDAAGNVTVLDKQGNVMKQLGPIGKPSATYEKTTALQKQQGKDLNLAIAEITDAIKPGGLLDKSTASGAGKLRDAAGNFVGYATEGSIASASLKPVADLALKMVPRFEGPQSDKDTASYKEAAGQLANADLPVKTRRAAAETVVRLMKARKGQFVNETMAAEGIGAGAPALPPGFTPD